MGSRGTLIKPPPADPDKSLIENVLEVVELDKGSNIFTNRREVWHPPGARGIFGGTVIALCLAAAQKTVPDDFIVHSYHCYFLLAGSGEIPILLHVEQVRDGRSFATRTVQVRQHGRCIFTTTMSFAREGAGGSPSHQVRHAAPMPAASAGGGLSMPRPPPDEGSDAPDSTGIQSLSNDPLQHSRFVIANLESPDASQRKTRAWVRARGKIAGGHQAHLNALAYMSDSGFVLTIARIHRLWQFSFEPEELELCDAPLREYVRNTYESEGMSSDPTELKHRPRLGMLVSLDHAIYFHAPKLVKADEWMLTEMESPWAGDGRGVVLQKIFNKDGVLLATCVQEGVVRLKAEPSKDLGRPTKL